MDEDKKTAPTEDQIKAANEAEEARWQGDYKEEDLSIPYKREVETEKTGEVEKKSDTDDKADVVEEYVEPTPIVTMQDPGEYKPADYSFEVTLKDGKSVKVNSPEDADKLADDPENFETPRQLSDFLKKSLSMSSKLERDREKWEADKEMFDGQTAIAEERAETIDTFVGEFQYLVNKGFLPKIDKQYLDADWTDPEVAKQDGVKDQIALLSYMEKENVERKKAKVKPITSVVDAYNAWKNDDNAQKSEAARKAKEDAEHAAGEARKVASARVAGVSASQQVPYVPKGIAVGNPNVFKRGAAQWDN